MNIRKWTLKPNGLSTSFWDHYSARGKAFHATVKPKNSAASFQPQPYMQHCHVSRTTVVHPYAFIMLTEKHQAVAFSLAGRGLDLWCGSLGALLANNTAAS